MHRVAPQQAGPLDQIILCFALTHHHSAQPQALTAIGFVDKNASHKPANPAESVQNDIHRLVDGLGCAADQLRHLRAHVILEALALPRVLVKVVNTETADIDVRGPEIQAG